VQTVLCLFNGETNELILGRAIGLVRYKGMMDVSAVSKNGWLRIGLVVLVGFALVVLLLLVIILALTAATLHYAKNPPSDSSDCSGATLDANSVALGLPRIGSLSWDNIVAGASGQTVEFWASSISNYDAWIDQFLTPQVQSLYGL